MFFAFHKISILFKVTKLQKFDLFSLFVKLNSQYQKYNILIIIQIKIIKSKKDLISVSQILK